MWLGRIGGTGTLALMLFGLTGCEDCYDGSCCGGWLGDYHAPAVPVGLASATGDGEIFLSWLPNQDADLAGYRVYVSRDPDGPYGRIGDTHRTTFTDHGAVNSRTYFYAVTAYDWCGNESELSYENVFDTPRPEGYGLDLSDASSGRPSDSGYDFSTFRRQSPDAPGTDIYFSWSGRTPWMYAATPAVGIQDVGYFRMEDLDWAPAAGWASSGRVELTPGHTYAVLTSDDYYAKFYVQSVGSGRVTIDWAVQLDRGNRELSPKPPATTSTAGTVAGGPAPALPGVHVIHERSDAQ